MKETILHQRKMIGRDNNGHVVRATAKLYSLGTQAPYFSFTTGHGADLDKIREAFNDISEFVDLHLCDQHGAPMHTVANAVYYAENGDKVALMRHLRITNFQATLAIGDTICRKSGAERREHMESILADLREGWHSEATACIEWLREEESEGDYMTDGAIQWDDDSPAIRYDGETFNIDDSHDIDGGLHVKWNGADYYLFLDSDVAGQAARDYWEDMAHNDKSEFTCLVGEAALIAWALGDSYAVGSMPTSSLEEWLDLSLSHPEEHFASYDGEERECLINESLADEMGVDWDHNGDEWQTAVFYRC